MKQAERIREFLDQLDLEHGPIDPQVLAQVRAEWAEKKPKPQGEQCEKS